MIIPAAIVFGSLAASAFLTHWIGLQWYESPIVFVLVLIAVLSITGLAQRFAYWAQDR